MLQWLCVHSSYYLNNEYLNQILLKLSSYIEQEFWEFYTQYERLIHHRICIILHVFKKMEPYTFVEVQTK
jgi:hypothetical protein